MNVPAWCTRLAVALVATAGVAQLVSCSQSTPQVSGVLDRPSGLAYVERASNDPDCTPAANAKSCSGQERATLFIADSEAQGVRVVKLTTDYTIDFSDSGVPTKKTSVDSEVFVQAPVVFFPLVIPAGGFPSELALSEDGSRLYVLSPATKTLHVLDVHEPMTSPTESYRPIHEIDLEGIGTSTGTPVALALLGSSGTTDFVAVAIDGGATGSVLAGLTIQVNGTDAQLLSSVTHPINAAPRSLLVRGDVVIASSAGPAACRATPAECVSLPASYELSLVRVDRANGTLALAAAQPGAVEVGGPTDHLVDYGALGLLAIRVDRPSAVFVEAMNDSYQRHAGQLPSPFTPDAERGTVQTAGRLDLRESPVGATAFASLPGAQVDTLIEGRTPVSLFRDPSGASATDVALVVHLDGRAAFVTGSPPELVMQDEAPVLSVYDETLSGGGAVQLGPGNRGFCTAAPQVCGDALAAPGCTADIVGTAAERTEAQVLRASYRGSLARSRTGALTLVSGATTAVGLELRDAAAGSFAQRLVQVGDSVLLQVSLRAGCANADPPSAEDAGVAVDHADAPFTVLETTVAEVSEVAGEAPVLRLAPVATAALAGCALGSVVPALALRYEVYPSGPELVVSRATALGVSRVFERVVTSSRTVTLGDVTEGVRHTAPLNVELVATRGFSCADDVRTGAECVTDDDCGGVTGSCESAAGSCTGRCNAKCTSPSCAATELVRRCSGLRFGIGQSVTASVDLNSDSLLTSLPAPTHAVFSPLRRSFFVSFPGARDLAELFSQAANTLTSTTAGSFNVRHLR